MVGLTEGVGGVHAFVEKDQGPQLVSVETARNVDAFVAHDPHPPA